jgi:hypothetical protein
VNYDPPGNIRSRWPVGQIVCLSDGVDLDLGKVGAGGPAVGLDWAGLHPPSSWCDRALDGWCYCSFEVDPVGRAGRLSLADSALRGLTRMRWLAGRPIEEEEDCWERSGLVVVVL